jgi:hypothetical protein
MTTLPSTAPTLNRLLAIQYRSLAMYLIWASPYRRPEDEEAWKAIQQVVADQEAYCGRIVELLLDRGWNVDYGDFPITFTGSHDLSLKYLVHQLVDSQKQTIKAIRECYEALSQDAVGQALADECLGAAIGHLEILEEVRNQKSSDTVLKVHEEAVETA